MTILTKANAKIKKGAALGYHTVGIHFAPYNLSGRNVCPFASPGCSHACLNTAGRGVYSKVQNSRIAKTQFFFEQPQAFMGQLVEELQRAQNYAAGKGVKFAVRLNLTSDISWEKIRYQGKTLMEWFPDTMWYDYSKIPQRMDDYLSGNFPANYHLTFSRSECNEVECFKVLIKGGNVAVVFRGELPKTWMGKKVVSGDKSDTRFLDPKNVVVGLSTKGRARKDQSGFVVDSE